MKDGALASFAAQLKALREAAGFTQEELATIAGVSVHAVSSLERGERRRPHFETVRALSTALDLTPHVRDALVASARAFAHNAAVDQLSAGSLPLTLTGLLGREHDLESLRQWLASPDHRLITLVGAGGVGKTRLALELARTVEESRSTRVAFVSLVSIRDPGLAACAIAEALGLADGSAADLPKRARAACEGRLTLLILDNFEQVIDAAPTVVDLLTAVSSIRVLVTSRAALRVRGEREYIVSPLALDDESSVTSGAGRALPPAVQLFVARAKDVQPSFTVTSTNRAAIAAICRRLDALPLAIELAVPWIKVLTVEELSRRLQQDVLLSAAAPRDLPERQQTMNATVAWSYELLGATERAVFRRLGVLPARFPIDAVAAAVAGRAGAVNSRDVLDAVAVLIDKSLLLRAETSIPGRPLYQMLETVRAYAALELSASGERDDALEGLARYCAGEAALAAVGLGGPEQAEWLNRVREDLESYRSALQWLLDGNRPVEACGIAASLLFFWLMRGHAAEGLWWYERIGAFASLPPAMECGALVASALMLYMQGDQDAGAARLDRADSIARTVGDVSLTAPIDTMCGHVEHARGNLTAARERFARGAEGYRLLPVPWGVGSALSGLAGATLASGHVEEAEQLLNEVMAMLQGSGPWFLLPPRCFRAVLEVQRGNADTAIALMRESLLHIRELQDRYAFVYALLPLAAAAALKREDLWAARLLGARDAVAERAGVTVAVAMLRELHERTAQDTRDRLGPERWTRAYAAGREASIDSLLNDIDTRSARPTRRRTGAPASATAWNIRRPPRIRPGGGRRT